MLRIIHELAVL